MTNILKPKNPNPNIILTYNNMPLKKPWKRRSLNWLNELHSLMLQAKPFQKVAPL